MAEQPLVAVVDYGLCNLFSVRQACLHVGLRPVITQDPNALREAAGIILPGVGAFGEAMANLRRLGLAEALRDAVREGRPLLGVCLGMQLLFSQSEEFGLHAGLDIIPGRVARFTAPPDRTMKIPHMGWSRLHPARDWSDTPLRGLVDGNFLYFVHSYYVVPENSDVVLATTRYGGTTFCSSLSQGKIFAVQFHPEKSATNGLSIYAAWADSLSG